MWGYGQPRTSPGYALDNYDSFLGSQKGKKAGAWKRKLRYEFVREKKNRAVSVRQHFALLLF